MFTWSGTIPPEGKPEDGSSWLARLDSFAVELDSLSEIELDLDSGLTFDSDTYNANFDNGKLKYGDKLYLKILNDTAYDKTASLGIKGKPVVDNPIELYYPSDIISRDVKKISNDLVSSQEWAGSLAQWIFENNSNKFEATIPLANIALCANWKVGDKITVVESRSGLSHRAVIKAIDRDIKNSTATIKIQSDRDSAFTPVGAPALLSTSSNVVRTIAGDGAEPAQPTNLTLGSVYQNHKSYIQASWTQNNERDVIGYEIAWSYDNSNWQTYNVFENTTSFEVKRGTIVFVKVRALDNEGSVSAWSSTESMTSSTDTTPPSTPAAVNVLSGFDTVLVSWESVNDEDLDYYLVEVAPDPYTAWSPLAKIKGSFYVHKNVAGGTSYKYRVTAIDTAGNASGTRVSVAATPNSIQAELDALDSDMAANTNAIDTLNNVTIPNLQNEINTNESDITTLNNTTIPNLQSQIDTNESDIATLNTVTIPALQTDISANQTSIDTLNNTTIPGLQSDISANQSSIDTLNNTTLPGIQADIDANTASIGTLNNTTIPNLQSQIDTNESNITTLNTVTIPGLQSDISANQTSINTLNNTTIPGLQSDIDTNQSNIDTLNNTTLPGLQADIDANMANISTLNNTTVPNLQSQIDANESDITALNNTTIPALQSDISANQTSIDTLNNTTIPGLQSDIDANTADISTLNSTTIPGLQSDISANQASINTLNSTTIPGLQTDIDANTSSINTLNNTTIPGLQTDIDANTSNISTNASNINTLNNTTIPGLQTDIDTNTSSIATLNNTTIPNLQASINTNTSDIATLNNTTIPSLQSQLDSNALDIEELNDETIPGLKTYIQSRGENLVTNGTGLFGDNTNFSGFAFDGSDAYGSSGSFTTGTYYTTKKTDELMPVNPDLTYLLAFYAKTNPHVGARHYSFIDCYDVDGNVIESHNHMYIAGSLTTLAQDLKDGDTVVYLTDASGWDDTTDRKYRRSFIFWDYKNSFGYQYPPETYSRHTTGTDTWALGAIDKQANTITLNNPWSGGLVPAGTQLSQGEFGGTFKYVAMVNVDVPDTWTRYEGKMQGTDYSGLNAGGKFPPGTAAVKIGWLVNRQVTGGKLWLSNISFNIDTTQLIKDIWGHSSDDDKIDGGLVFVGSIGATQIAAGAITAEKIAAGAIIAGKIGAGAVTANEIAAGAITTVKIAAGAVTANEIAAGTITANEIEAGAITATELATNAVTTAKIAAGAITAEKIEAGSITANEIAAGAITVNELATNAVTSTKIAAGAITTEKLAAGSVTANEIGAGAITTAKLAAGAVTANEIAAGTITANEIEAGAITATELATNAVTSTKIAAGAITAEKIEAGAITANEIGANAVTTAKIEAGAVTANEIATNAVTANKIAANAVTATKIDAGAVTTEKVAAGAIVADKIGAGEIVSSKIAAGAITAEKLLISPPGAALNIDPTCADPSAWETQTGSGVTFTTVTDGKVGNTVMRSGTSSLWQYEKHLIPFDPTKTYRVRVWVRSGSANGTFYLAVLLQNASGSNIGGDGTWWFYSASGVHPGSSWTYYEGLFWC